MTPATPLSLPTGPGWWWCRQHQSTVHRRGKLPHVIISDWQAYKLSLRDGDSALWVEDGEGSDFVSTGWKHGGTTVTYEWVGPLTPPS